MTVFLPSGGRSPASPPLLGFRRPCFSGCLAPPWALRLGLSDFFAAAILFALVPVAAPFAVFPFPSSCCDDGADYSNLLGSPIPVPGFLIFSRCGAFSRFLGFPRLSDSGFLLVFCCRVLVAGVLGFLLCFQFIAVCRNSSFLGACPFGDFPVREFLLVCLLSVRCCSFVFPGFWCSIPVAGDF